MSIKPSHAVQKGFKRSLTIVWNVMSQISSTQLIKNANHAQKVTNSAANVSSAIPHEVLAQSTANANAKQSMEHKWPTKQIQINVYVLQTFRYGMEYIVSLVQQILNMIPVKTMRLDIFGTEQKSGRDGTEQEIFLSRPMSRKFPKSPMSKC